MKVRQVENLRDTLLCIHISYYPAVAEACSVCVRETKRRWQDGG